MVFEEIFNIPTSIFVATPFASSASFENKNSSNLFYLLRDHV